MSAALHEKASLSCTEENRKAISSLIDWKIIACLRDAVIVLTGLLVDSVLSTDAR